MRPVARICEECGKPDIARPGGAMSYRYVAASGQWARGYFHPACFRKRLAGLSE